MTALKYGNFELKFDAKFKPKFGHIRSMQQSGMVLFLALIALVVLSLAAVALIRSVDTNNLIAGYCAKLTRT